MIADSLFRDIRIGLRVLFKEKGFCALAVVVLALGIAAEQFLRILGVGPMMGRDFTAADNIPGAGKVAIIGYGIWAERLRRRSQHHRQGPPHQAKPVWCRPTQGMSRAGVDAREARRRGGSKRVVRRHGTRSAHLHDRHHPRDGRRARRHAGTRPPCRPGRSDDRAPVRIVFLSTAGQINRLRVECSLQPRTDSRRRSDRIPTGQTD
jgi:hypothetical protein